jgi:hypothetical protein
LYGAQIPTITQQMRRKGMSQSVRRYMRWQVKFDTKRFDKPLYRTRA